MRNIQITLRSDYVNGSGDNFNLHFDFDEVEEEKEIRITSINDKDNSQHDYALAKDEYLFLRKQFDEHFGIQEGE